MPVSEPANDFHNEAMASVSNASLGEMGVIAVVSLMLLAVVYLGLQRGWFAHQPGAKNAWVKKTLPLVLVLGVAFSARAFISLPAAYYAQNMRPEKPLLVERAITFGAQRLAFNSAVFMARSESPVADPCVSTLMGRMHVIGPMAGAYVDHWSRTHGGVGASSLITAIVPDIDRDLASFDTIKAVYRAQPILQNHTQAQDILKYYPECLYKDVANNAVTDGSKTTVK